MLHSIYVSVDIRVEQYKDLSRFDSLTGALTRKAFEESLNRKILRAQREGSPLSLVMADLDHFKSINDNFGHLAGDFVLRAVVRFLRNSFREVDVVARYGGEEFCIIMPGTGKHTAVHILERIRKQLAETTFLYEKENLSITVTCSFGLSDFPVDSATPEGLIKKADESLYRAKKTGRNRVVIYGEETIQAAEIP